MTTGKSPSLTVYDCSTGERPSAVGVVSTGTDDVVATSCTSYADGSISTTLDAVSGSSSLHEAATTTKAELTITAAPQRRTDDNMGDHSRQPSGRSVRGAQVSGRVASFRGENPVRHGGRSSAFAGRIRSTVGSSAARAPGASSRRRGSGRRRRRTSALRRWPTRSGSGHDPCHRRRTRPARWS